MQQPSRQDGAGMLKYLPYLIAGLGVSTDQAHFIPWGPAQALKGACLNPRALLVGLERGVLIVV